MTDAIAHYHELLADPDLAEASHVMLEDQLRRRDMMFGDRPLCTVLRPRFFSPERFRWLAARIAPLLVAFQRAHQAAMTQPALRAQFRLADWEESLVLADPGLQRCASPHGRLDCFLIRTGRTRWHLRNTTPRRRQAPGTTTLLAELVRRHPGHAGVPAAVRSPAGAGAPGRRHGRPRCLAASFRADGTGPRIAIVDWDDVPTRSRIPDLSGVLPVPGARGRDRGSAVDGIPGWPAVRRWRAGRPDLQASAHQRAGRAGRTRTRRGPRRARPGRLHGESLPLQAAAQEGQPGRALRRAQRRPVHRRPARGDADDDPLDPGSGRATHRVPRTSGSTSCRSSPNTASSWCSSRTTTTAGPAIVLGWDVADGRMGVRPGDALARLPYIVQERIGHPQRAVSGAGRRDSCRWSTGCWTPRRSCCPEAASTAASRGSRPRRCST